MTQAEWARAIAYKLLAIPLPRRWAYTQGVAAQASRLAVMLGDDAEVVETAAWLHDIGYSPELGSGFHPLDGLDTSATSKVLTKCSVSWWLTIRALRSRPGSQASKHSQRRARALAGRPHRGHNVCDMTTGPDGSTISVDRRLADILTRYEDGHIVTRSIRQSAPTLKEATEAVAKRLADSANGQRRSLSSTRSARPRKEAVRNCETTLGQGSSRRARTRP